MKKVLKLSYDGSPYHGWQKQLNARSVQQEIEEKLSLLLGENIETLGCGRTDAGVHALEYYAEFEHSNPWKTGNIKKLNQMLSDEIAIHQVLEVDDNFNARFDAVSRTYQYWITQTKNPFLNKKALYRYGNLDLEAMNNAAELLKNYTHFECFSKVNTDVKTFRCEVKKAYWYEKNGVLIFEIEADRFLRNMVRAIVGTLLDVGMHRINIQDFKNIIESNNRSKAGRSVEAYALYLVQVKYPEHFFKLVE